MQITIEAEYDDLSWFVGKYKYDSSYASHQRLAFAIGAVLPERILFHELTTRAMGRMVVAGSHYGHDYVEIETPFMVNSVNQLSGGYGKVNVNSNGEGMGMGGIGFTVFAGGWVEVR